MEMYVNGHWRNSSASTPILSPYSGELVDTVPDASAEDAEQALAAAVRGAAAMAALTAYQRTQILNLLWAL